MKETGIIMSGDHPRLILDKTKVMTRRTYGLEKVNANPSGWEFKRLNDGAVALFWRSNVMEEDIALCKCPYGQVGDRLWVREQLRGDGKPNNRRVGIMRYGADGEMVITIEDNMGSDVLWDYKKLLLPAMFMPRWASRITLEITEVRVERVQDVTEEDATKEGFLEEVRWKTKQSPWRILWYKELWDSLNAKRGYGWEVNPWVWVISFKKL